MNTMKKIISTIYLLCILTGNYIYSQNVGINTDTPGAALEVKGFSNATDTTLRIINGSNREILTMLDNGRLGIGQSSPAVRLDLRGTSDNPIIGIGTTTKLASTVGGGAIRYMEGTKELHYSDGEEWFRLQSNALRPCMVAPNDYIAGSYADGTTTRLIGFVPIYDSHGAFDMATSEYEAPIDGMYVVSFTFSFTKSAIAANTYIEGRWVAENGESIKCIQAYPDAGSGQAGFTCSGTLRLSLGEKIWPEVWHNLGRVKTLRVFGSSSDVGFNELSIFAQ
ncbi:hypothetical protein SAMN05444362_10476 [Dysgonomonas macrotermitis]|uniref:C1q domain-containing protein n=2 Tax=Dysgonomonas macrotermitis TaxID=1346286 RepID=A0A1M4ZFK9_9BACT|nr:hypothetical protein SAMN05444362_10476 [Dysgonomonas macrotermitis]